METISIRGKVFPTCVGVFPAADARTNLGVVFPTCVGVFPSGASWRTTLKGLPHVRGGVSTRRRWLCIWLSVFPTCVGVFLLQ